MEFLEYADRVNTFYARTYVNLHDIDYSTFPTILISSTLCITLDLVEKPKPPPSNYAI